MLQNSRAPFCLQDIVAFRFHQLILQLYIHTDDGVVMIHFRAHNTLLCKHFELLFKNTSGPAIHWIVIYPVYNVIHLSNNLGLVDSVIHQMFKLDISVASLQCFKNSKHYVSLPIAPYIYMNVSSEI